MNTSQLQDSLRKKLIEKEIEKLKKNEARMGTQLIQCSNLPAFSTILDLNG